MKDIKKTADDYGFAEYREFSPTSFDHHINVDHMCDDDDTREHWAIMPVTQNRDSQAIDRVNFDEFLAGLGDESETVEVHRFRHWACGWLEIIIVDPSNSKAMSLAYDMASSLEDYPILNEEKLSEVEYDEAMESWDNWARRDVERIIENELDIDDASDRVSEWLKDNSPDYETHNDGPHFDVERIAEDIMRPIRETE